MQTYHITINGTPLCRSPERNRLKKAVECSYNNLWHLTAILEWVRYYLPDCRVEYVEDGCPIYQEERPNFE